MPKVAVGTIVAVMLLLAGMLAGNAEAAPLKGCCNVAGIHNVRNGLWGSSFVSASCIEVLQTIWQVALSLSSATALAGAQGQHGATVPCELHPPGVITLRA